MSSGPQAWAHELEMEEYKKERERIAEAARKQVEYINQYIASYMNTKRNPLLCTHMPVHLMSTTFQTPSFMYVGRYINE